MVDADVAVHVEEAEHATALGDSAPGEIAPELLRAALTREKGELLAERLHLEDAVEPEDPSEIRGCMLLERLRTLDPEQGQEHERDHGCAQAVERGGESSLAVDGASGLDHAALDETRDCEQDTGARYVRSRREDRRRVVQEAEACEETIAAPVERVQGNAWRRMDGLGGRCGRHR